MTRSLPEALEDLVSIGVPRVLTSGGGSRVLDRIDTLAALNRLANGRIVVMPGSGVNSGNVEEIARRTGCTEVHRRETELFQGNRMERPLAHLPVKELLFDAGAAAGAAAASGGGGAAASGGGGAAASGGGGRSRCPERTQTHMCSLLPVVLPAALTGLHPLPISFSTCSSCGWSDRAVQSRMTFRPQGIHMASSRPPSDWEWGEARLAEVQEIMARLTGHVPPRPHTHGPWAATPPDTDRCVPLTVDPAGSRVPPVADASGPAQAAPDGRCDTRIGPAEKECSRTSQPTPEPTSGADESR